MNDIELTPTGLSISGLPDFDTWLALWQWLEARDAAMPWILGDMLNYGEVTYGEMYTQALTPNTEQRHFTLGTLAQYKFVAKAWPASSRLNDVPWSYYQTTASLPLEHRIALLTHCEENGIKRDELREMVRQLNDGKQPNPVTYPDDLNHELIVENHKNVKQIAEQQAELAELRQQVDARPPAVILPEELPAYAQKAIDNLVNLLTAEIDGYDAVTVYADRRVLWTPK